MSETQNFNLLVELTSLALGKDATFNVNNAIKNIPAVIYMNSYSSVTYIGSSTPSLKSTQTRRLNPLGFLLGSLSDSRILYLGSIS